MKREKVHIAGDTPGQDFTFDVIRLGGGNGPRVYMQAALHAQELPGHVAILALLPMLEKAESEGRLRSAITLVPHANPIGLSQSLMLENMGRFDLASRSNYNRNVPLPGSIGPDLPTAVERLKQLLLDLSADADLVLDLHCDDEGPVYLYVPEEFLEAAMPLADALQAKCILTWPVETDGGGAFEDATAKRHWHRGEGKGAAGKLATTVELRGIHDVEPYYATKDAAGLYAYLVAIGAVEDRKQKQLPSASLLIRSQYFTDMLRTPVSGAILYHIDIDTPVAAGDLVAEIITPAGPHAVRAQRDGHLLTRRARRFARVGDDIAKIICDGPNPSLKPGPLEA
jgi:uncharacterized protein